MQTVTVISKTDLVQHESNIESLFLKCFGDRLSLDLWRWAYLDNPHGEPVVSLCYDEDLLVGHYAAIPIPLKSSSGRINSYLSMTTMVAASHRQHGLFVKLAENTYGRATSLGVDFVMGFPNDMSTPGFKKRLNWDLPPPDFVASVSKDQLLELIAARAIPNSASFRFELEDEVSRKWRLSRPGATYKWENGLAYKEFDNGIDLLAFKSIADLEHLPDCGKINLLVPVEAEALAPFKSFDYQFGGISLKSTFNPKFINRQMALSDLF